VVHARVHVQPPRVIGTSGRAVRTLVFMRMRALVPAMLICASVLIVRATPVAACSCAGPPKLAVEFTGEAIESTAPATLGRLWAFRTTAVTAGAAVGDIVEVAIDGQDPPQANGLLAVSTCSIGPYPKPGGTYEVGAYEGSVEDGSRTYFANGCGGYVREVTAGPDDAEPRVSEAAPPVQQAEGTLLPVLGASVVLVGVAGGALRQVRRRS
jgi:hypothetical protein